MKNKLSDLNNHLFMELERLNDEDITEEQLDKEIKRAKAISGVADKVISNASLILEAKKFIDDAMDGDIKIPLLTD